MVSVRLRIEIPAPTRKWVETLPEGARDKVVLSFHEILPRLIKEINIDGETYEVHASQRTSTGDGVGFRLLGATKDFSKSTTISLFVDIVYESREEPSK